jgi:hypothetical protein
VTPLPQQAACVCVWGGGCHPGPDGALYQKASHLRLLPLPPLPCTLLSTLQQLHSHRLHSMSGSDDVPCRLHCRRSQEPPLCWGANAAPLLSPPPSVVPTEAIRAIWRSRTSVIGLCKSYSSKGTRQVAAPALLPSLVALHRSLGNLAEGSCGWLMEAVACRTASLAQAQAQPTYSEYYAK